MMMLANDLLRLSPSMRRLLPPFLALALSVGIFVNNVLLAPNRVAAAQVLALSEQIRMEDVALNSWLRDLDAPAPRLAEAAAPLRDDLLKQLNSIALQTGIHVVRLKPLSDKRVEAEMEGSFSTIVAFIGQLEARGGILNRLQLQARTSDANGAVLVAVTFLLDWAPRPGEMTISPGTARHLEGGVVTNDAFRWSASVSEARLGVGHQLTGITRMDETFYATIDGRDYRVGDPMGGSMITAIRDDAVQLSSGSAQLWLHFQSQEH